MDHNNMINLRKLSQQYAYTALDMHETIARKAGFPGTDHKYLGFFLQKGKLTAGELAELSGLTTGAVTGLIDRFEKKSLVKRLRDKDDRRKVFVVPNSEKITKLLGAYYAQFQVQTDEILSSFSDQDRQVIETFLIRSIDLMTKTRNNLQ